MIYGVTECTSQVGGERLEHDRTIVRSLVQLCEAENDNTKLFVLRLGKANVTGDTPRPLLVKQRDNKVKQAIFRHF